MEGTSRITKKITSFILCLLIVAGTTLIFTQSAFAQTDNNLHVEKQEINGVEETKVSNINNFLKAKVNSNYLRNLNASNIDSKLYQIYTALGYSNAEIKKMNANELNSISTVKNAVSRSSIMECNDNGNVRELTRAERNEVLKKLKENTVNDCKNEDGNKTGYMKSHIVIYQDSKYDKINKYYGYRVEGKMTWLKTPSHKLIDKFYIAWAGGNVKINNEYSHDCKLNYLWYHYMGNPGGKGTTTACTKKLNYNTNFTNITVTNPFSERVECPNKTGGHGVETQYYAYNECVSAKIILRSNTYKYENFSMKMGYVHKYVKIGPDISLSFNGTNVGISCGWSAIPKTRHYQTDVINIDF